MADDIELPEEEQPPVGPQPEPEPQEPVVERYALIEGGVVLNVTLWDGVTAYELPEGQSLVVCVDQPVSQGWTHGEEGFAPPAQVVPDQRAKLNADITAARDAAFFAGYAPTSGPLAGHRLQLRNADDRTNWFGALTKYQAMKAAGQGATEGAHFRTQDNVNVTLSFNDGVSALFGLLGWAESVMQHSWTLKDALAATADEDLADFSISDFPTE